MALLNLQNISLSFGSFPLLDCMDLQIHENEKISILGRNGAGKSTLMRLINGDIESESGIILREKGIKTALLSQDLHNLNGTVYNIIMEGITSLDSFENHMDNYEEQKTRRQIEKALSLLTLDSDLLFENLSAGMKRRVLLGRAIVNDPDILLLDEPTNHLDIDSILWLENFLCRYDKTVIFVTHDRAFLQKISTRIIELDRGKIFDWKCGYHTFLQRKEAWLESEETQNALFDKRLAKEEVWIRKGIKARRTRNEGRVRTLKKMRDERSKRREQQGNVHMKIQKTENSGKIIIEATNISFGYDSSKLINDFSTIIQRGDKIGIIGPNGCGKSTLIKILLKELMPDAGGIKIGARIEKAYFDQLRNQLDEKGTVKENVTDGNEIIDFNGKKKHVIGYLQDFLFTPDRADVKVEVLSGGEKNRLLLAKLFTRPLNFLIMDEPTNDLDIETIELLEELLLHYKGALLLVSHDRAFLNNVVTSTFVFEGDALVKEYAGGYDDWLSQRKTDNIKKSNGLTKSDRKKDAREKKTPVKIKLSFKEKKELESIPVILEEKENRKKEIFEVLADPSFYQESGSRVAEIKAELEALEKELDFLFLRWEELEAFERC